MIISKYKNKRVIVTGHTGFKGSWLTLWLYLLGAKVLGISLPSKKNDHFSLLNIKNRINSRYINILDKKKIESAILNFKPDYVFHLAAQSLITKSLQQPFLTWKTNVIGTINLLESVKQIKKRVNCIFITSDKCYENLEKRSGYKETDRLGGEDPYSASKASAELAINSYFLTFLKSTKHRVVTARAGNVIGGGDWSHGRILPDCMNSIILGKKVKIRSLTSSRPWQHVLDIIYGYLLLGIKLSQNKKLNGHSFNFGPNKSVIKTTLNLILEIKRYWPALNYQKNKKRTFKETNCLVLNSSKANKKLKWKTNLNFSQTVKFTVDWYKDYYFIKKNKIKSTIYYVSKKQIDLYIKKFVK